MYHLFKDQAERTPDGIAITAPGRMPLSYARLWHHIEDVVEALNGMGLGRNDRVAIVLSNGPEMATAFLAVTACATSAPLNPAYRADEFDFYLSDLKAKALIIQSATDSPAVAVAKARGIPIIELLPILDSEAGVFSLTGDPRLRPTQSGFAQSGDVALVLHTSGTTSKPKIVPLTQTNIFASAFSIKTTLALSGTDRCLNVMPLFHVHGLIGAVLSSLTAGGSIVCTPGFYAPRFFEWIEEFHPTWYTAVPTMHQAILAHSAANRKVIERCPLRFIRSSSSALPPQLMAELEGAFNAPVIESYGMTEASHQVASNPLPPRERKAGSVGMAAGSETAIMDEAGRLLPAGKTGEIVIQGTNVLHGHENNSTVNKSAFINGWFRTGDRGFLDVDGYLFITGRLKEIINRGGEKISPREVDEVLMDHPAIAQAVTFAMPHPQLGEDVAAAVVLRVNTSGTEREIREYAAKRLSDFKVPRRVIIVNEIPKGPTGKLQRIGLAEKLGLAAPDADLSEVKAEFIAPRTAVEEALTEIWVEVLGVEKVGIHDNFFQLGGDSILAARLISRVRQAMQAELLLPSVFELPTVAEIAEMIKTDQSVHPPPLIPVSHDVSLPLSFAQQRLWLLDQLQPGSASYNIPQAIQMSGALNIAVLQQALETIVNRHEVLRTTFPVVNGNPAQVIAEGRSIVLPVVDLSRLAQSEREVEALRLAAEEAQRPFDLAQGPLVRASLLRLCNERHILLLTIHHSIGDGWSTTIFFRELGALYEAFSSMRPSPLPELPIQYADYAVWQREWLQGEVLEKHLSYWKQQFKTAPAVLELPTDRPRPAVQTFRGGHQTVALSKSLSEKIKALSWDEGVTLYMTLLGAFQVLLLRYTGQDDIVVGSPIAGRNRAEVEALIGFFVNTMVMRTDLSGDPTFREVLARVKEVALGAYTHQDLPFEKLVEVLQPERDLSRMSLFQVMFQLRNIPKRELKLTGLEVCDFEFDSGIAKFDLSLDMFEKADELSCLFEYNTDLFDAATIGRMAGHFHTLLNSIVTDPDQPVSALSLLTETERHQLLVGWNNTSIDYPRDLCIHQLFEAQVEKTPDATAVTFGTESLTYSQINARSNQLARYLRRRGAGPDMLVGICLERSLEMVVGLLGILKAGAAYVPLDPEYPRARLAYMLEDTSVCLLLTQERLLERLPKHAGEMLCLDRDRNLFEGEAEGNLEEITQPEHLAYVFYTSGSTGKPKGVLISQRGVVNYFAYLVNVYDLSSADVVLQIASPSFDPSVRDIIAPLTMGAQVVVVTDTNAREPAALLSKIEEHRVSCLLSVVPTMLNGLIEAASDQDLPYDSLRLILVSGEALQLSVCRKAKTVFGRALVVNQYGPTECTMTSTYYPILAPEYGRDIAQIGRPIPNSQTYVLDRDLNLVPVGVRGELHIGGVGLARGYLNRSELTAEKFIPNPFRHEPGARLYKTGDLARYLPDGNIEFLGRKDDQVKIRGYRVELPEIAAVLGEHTGVCEAVVVAREEVAGDKRLVAYIVSEQEHPPALDKLRGFLRERLPEYMVPSAFVVLDELPLTPNGKVDRRALPAPDQARSELLSDVRAPRGPLEVQLTRIWQKLLNVSSVGVCDNFFMLGGHSLLGTQLIAHIREKFGVEMTLRTLFDAPTIEHLSLEIERLLMAQVEAMTEDEVLGLQA